MGGRVGPQDSVAGRRQIHSVTVQGRRQGPGLQSPGHVVSVQTVSGRHRDPSRVSFPLQSSQGGQPDTERARGLSQGRASPGRASRGQIH